MLARECVCVCVADSETTSSKFIRMERPGLRPYKPAKGKKEKGRNLFFSSSSDWVPRSGKVGSKQFKKEPIFNFTHSSAIPHIHHHARLYEGGPRTDKVTDHQRFRPSHPLFPLSLSLLLSTKWQKKHSPVRRSRKGSGEMKSKLYAAAELYERPVGILRVASSPQRV